MKKVLSLIYGFVCWFGFLAIFTYMIGFLGDFIVPKTVNSGLEGPVAQSIMINLVLMAMFGAHHSIAARPEFKKWLTMFIPHHLERSTYVLVSNILVILLLSQWRPITLVVWHVDNPTVRTVLYAIFGLGWGTIVLSSFLINHFDLMGMRQVYLNFIGKEYAHVPFKASFLYKIVRNPLMLGWFMTFWATPHMTAGHLEFAIGMMVYGIIGILCEERTHVQFLGDDYQQYKARTPMILPIPKLGRTGQCPFH